METDYIKYARDVIDGKVVAGELVKLACHRFFAFMEKYEFRFDKVERVIDFYASLRHYTGRHAQKPFILQPWQQLIIACIFGFYHRITNERITRMVYIEVARKNGKTAAFGAALALYCLIADGEANADVELAANSKEQAKICFDMCSKYSASLDPKGRYLSAYRDKIKYDKTASFLRVFAADDSKLDGYNSSAFFLIGRVPFEQIIPLEKRVGVVAGCQSSPIGLHCNYCGL